MQAQGYRGCYGARRDDAGEKTRLAKAVKEGAITVQHGPDKEKWQVARIGVGSALIEKKESASVLCRK
ncbi:hypothetical protein D3C78_1839660 [compost metagenome]